MRIAVLLSGQMRTAWYCLEHILNNIIIPNNADVFVFTGTDFKNQNNNKSEEGTISSYRGRGDESLIKINEKDFLCEKLGSKLKKYNKSNFIDNYWNEYQNILNESINYNKEYIELNKDNISDSHPIPCDFVIAQYLSIKKGMEMIIEYENENNIKYDFIIRQRLDYGLFKKINVQEVINKYPDKDIFYASDVYGPCFICEYFFMGKAELMKKICLEFVHMYGKLRFPEEILKKLGKIPIFIPEAQFFLFSEHLKIKRGHINADHIVYKEKIEKNDNIRIENNLDEIETLLFIHNY